jgi:molybdopterin-binding protein
VRLSCFAAVRDAIYELKLKRGDEAVAIIKSTEVMIDRTS